MSVINRMLQELESRHEQPRDRLPGIVRAVPPARGDYRRFLPLLGVALAAAALGGIGLWAWQSHSTPPVVKSAPAAAPLQPIPVVEQGAPQPLPAPPAAASIPLLKASPEVQIKAVPPRAPSRAPESGQAEALVLKSAPGATAEGSGIKQVSPTQRADQIYREGLAARAQGRAAEAQPLFEEALKLDPRHLGARQALLALLVDAKRYAQAEQLLQDGLALNLSSPAWAMALARLQMERGDQNAALGTLERHAPQAQDSADYHAFQAALLQRAERHAEAVAHYQAALRGQPHRAVWWMGLGISLQAEKRVADAEQAFSRARATPGLSPELQAFVEQRLKQLH